MVLANTPAMCTLTQHYIFQNHQLVFSPFLAAIAAMLSCVTSGVALQGSTNLTHVMTYGLSAVCNHSNQMSLLVETCSFSIRPTSHIFRYVFLKKPLMDVFQLKSFLDSSGDSSCSNQPSPHCVAPSVKQNGRDCDHSSRHEDCKKKKKKEPYLTLAPASVENCEKH